MRFFFPSSLLFLSQSAVLFTEDCDLNHEHTENECLVLHIVGKKKKKASYFVTSFYAYNPTKFYDQTNWHIKLILS